VFVRVHQQESTSIVQLWVIVIEFKVRSILVLIGSCNSLWEAAHKESEGTGSVRKRIVKEIRVGHYQLMKYVRTIGSWQ